MSWLLVVLPEQVPDHRSSGEGSFDVQINRGSMERIEN